MKQKRNGWMNGEPRPGMCPKEFLPKPKPLTQKQKAFFAEVHKFFEEARKWKKNHKE